jgi:hypothetical protein
MVIVLVLGFTHIKFIKKGYFVTFHKSGTIGSVDTNEKQDGMFDIYLNGKIVRRENFKSGSLDGWKIDYYDNGNIRIKESFKVGRSDGPKIMYYKNGQIEQKSYRKNDKVEGMEYVYYEDGSLKYKRNWINNNPYGDFYYYYQNKKAELYHAYDILGNRFYLCRYDTMGRISKCIGNVFSSFVYSKDKDAIEVLKTGNTYKSISDLYVTVANPPQSTTEILILINNKVRTDFITEKSDNNTVIVKNAFTNRGVYNIKISGRFVEKSNPLTQTDLGLTIIKQ